MFSLFIVLYVLFWGSSFDLSCENGTRLLESASHTCLRPERITAQLPPERCRESPYTQGKCGFVDISACLDFYI